jgi:hypothetical protein
MSITLNNNVINQRGTPSIITDVFSNRPLATNLQVGTLFFSSNTNIIYQVYLVGTVRTWETMGGGAGGTQDLNSVLSNGTFLLDNYEIESDGSVNLSFANFNQIIFSNSNQFIVSQVTNWELLIDEFKGLRMNSSLLYLQIDEETINGFKVDALGGGFVWLGDYAQTIEGTYLYISNETNANGVYIYDGLGAQSKVWVRYDNNLDIGIDRDVPAYNVFTIGDWDNNQTCLQVIGSLGRISTMSYTNMGNYGIDIDFNSALARFGAGFDNFSGTYATCLQINCNNGYFTINETEQLEITNSNNLISTNAGTITTNKLKISINGIGYYIPLLAQ